jgi:hypothetical protein
MFITINFYLLPTNKHHATGTGVTVNTQYFFIKLPTAIGMTLNTPVTQAGGTEH